MSKSHQPTSALCAYTNDQVFVRGKDLCAELMGRVSFTEMMFLDIVGRLPSERERRVIDVVMVTLMEHGLTPSAIAARMTYSSAPEAIQGAVAAGLLGAGSVLLGTIEQCAKVLREIVGCPEGLDRGAQLVAERDKHERRATPGFGHPHHKPNDPRAVRLFELAKEWGVSGSYVGACQALARAVDAAHGKHLTLNASAAMAALLCEIEVSGEVMRGVAIISRAAGLVAHVVEERSDPAAWVMTKAAADSVMRAGSGS